MYGDIKKLYAMNQDEIVKKYMEEITFLLKGVNRPGIENVVRYLHESTFFSARCHSHHQFRGGLAVHSLGVYKEFEKLNTGLPEDSIRIVSLLHDICKSHHPSYDHIGKGHHGYRSVQLLKALKFKFNIGEYYAIVKHMHRIKHTPAEGQYGICDSIRHYLHQSDHRDAETFPKGFDSYTTNRSSKYLVDSYIYSTCKKGKEILIDELHNRHNEFYAAFGKLISNK